MIFLPICLFLAAFASAKLESATPLGRNVARNAQTPTSAASPSETKKDGDECDADFIDKILCQNDRLQFCGPNNLIMSTPCVINGRQGFCNCEKTSCVAEKPVCSDETTKCFHPNTKFPDNLNCHKFSYCNEKLEKKIYECPGNLIYSPTEEKCLDQNTARCSRIVCPRPGNTIQLVPFPQARNYYVFCYKGIGDVRKCKDKFYAVKNNICQFDCSLKKASGLFKDPNEERCKKGIYYACRRAGTNYTTVQAKCAPGLTFDEKEGLCTAENSCTAPGSQQ